MESRKYILWYRIKKEVADRANFWDNYRDWRVWKRYKTAEARLQAFKTMKGKSRVWEYSMKGGADE